MKKWMLMVLIGTCAAGLAVAETNDVPWYKKIFNKSADETAPVVEPAPEVSAPAPVVGKTRPKLTPEQMKKMKARRAHMQKFEGFGERKHQMNPRQMAKMKAQREALMKLGKAARSETDPAKKKALVAELRTKLTEVSDAIQARAKQRLAAADREIKGLEKRIADYDKNKEARIDEQVRRILAGEPLKGPGGKHHGGPGAGKNKKGPKPHAAE